jgi:hypothetical protein
MTFSGQNAVAEDSHRQETRILEGSASTTEVGEAIVAAIG